MTPLKASRASESSFGWDPKEKQAEMFHIEGRYIILFQDIITSDGTIRPSVCAFASFRFDVEPTIDNVDENIIYL